ncbi:hypothetical protein LENED_008813 [Lentinula edodes]|uniref:Uncharacterized protein n=1 Tax=Lentinula edodes TaxID=5353 RepID=A0A1Q3EI57_LENED|nr:hypothetical protein LENED_008813 [Lentinula edodes]
MAKLFANHSKIDQDDLSLFLKEGRPTSILYPAVSSDSDQQSASQSGSKDSSSGSQTKIEDEDNESGVSRPIMSLSSSAMQVDRIPSSSAIDDPTMRVNDESVVTEAEPDLIPCQASASTSSSDFSHHSRPNLDDRQTHGATDDSEDGSGSDTDTESNVGDSKSGNGLEHTDTEIISDVSASGAGYSGSQSSLMSVPSQLIRDTMDEVLAKSNDGQNDEEVEEGTGKLRGFLELSGHEEYEARCTHIDEDRDTETERGIGRGCAYTSFSTVSSISPTSSTSDLSSLSQCSSSSELDDPPPAPPAISSVAGPTTTTHPKQPPAPPPPQTGLPDIPVLWSERDAAAELPKNHNPQGMNEKFQASRTNYISDFSSVLHHDSKYKYGVGDVHPRKIHDVVEETQGCASSLISSSASAHVPRIDHSDPLNVADSSSRTHMMLDSESISSKDLASSPLVDAPNTIIKSNDQLEEIRTAKINDNENETSPLDPSTSAGQSSALSSDDRTSTPTPAILMTSPLKRKRSRSVEHLSECISATQFIENDWDRDILFAPSLPSPSSNTTPSASGVTMPQHPPRKRARTENNPSLSTSQRPNSTKRPLTASASSNSVFSPPARRDLLRRARSHASVFTRPSSEPSANTEDMQGGTKPLLPVLWKFGFTSNGKENEKGKEREDSFQGWVKSRTRQSFCPTRGSRRNAAVSYDISRHLPINQLPPMQSHQHVNPRDVVLPSMPQFMRMMFANDTRRLRNPRSRHDNIPLTPPGLQHPSNRTLQRVTPLPPGVPPHGLSTPSQFKVPLNILYLRILETMFRPITYPLTPNLSLCIFV